MSSSFLEQHLALIKGVHDKSIKLNKKKNRKSIVGKILCCCDGGVFPSLTSHALFVR